MKLIFTAVLNYRLRERVDLVKSKLYPDLEHKENERAEFLPVQWRSALRLDGGEQTFTALPRQTKTDRCIQLRPY